MTGAIYFGNSHIVLICTRDMMKNLHAEYMDYATIAGTGGKFNLRNRNRNRNRNRSRNRNRNRNRNRIRNTNMKRNRNRGVNRGRASGAGGRRVLRQQLRTTMLRSPPILYRSYGPNARLILSLPKSLTYLTAP